MFIVQFITVVAQDTDHSDGNVAASAGLVGWVINDISVKDDIFFLLSTWLRFVPFSLVSSEEKPVLWGHREVCVCCPCLFVGLWLVFMVLGMNMLYLLISYHH
jgi:hypothetical protein